MADEDKAAQQASPKKSRGKLFQLVVIGLLMAAEGIGVFFLAKSLDVNPDIALAVEGQGNASLKAGDNHDQLAEIELAECRPTNNISGTQRVYHIKVLALVSSLEVERAEDMVRVNRGRIHDRVNYVVRSAEPKHLDEPELNTIRRRIKHEMGELFEDEGLIKAIIIPEMLQ